MDDEALLEILSREHDYDHQWLVAAILGARGDVETIPLLLEKMPSEYAIRALRLMGEQGIEALLELSPVFTLRTFAAFPHPRAVNLLKRHHAFFQRFGDFRDRDSRTVLLKQFGVEVFPALTNFLRETKSHVYDLREIVTVLREVVPLPWPAELMQLLNKHLPPDDPAECRAAIRHYLDGVETEDDDLLWLAADVLGRQKDHEAIPLLFEVLEMGKGDALLAKQAIWALGEIGDSEVLPRLRALQPRWKERVPPFDQLNREDRVGVQVELALALAKLKAPEAQDAMLECLPYYDDLDWGASSTEGFVLLGPEVVEPLLKALKSKKPTLIIGAVLALQARKEPMAVEPLIRLLSYRHKTWEDGVIGYVAAALGALGDMRAAVPLAALLDDMRWGIKWSVRQALVTLAIPEIVEPLAEHTTGTDAWVVDYDILQVLAKLGEVAHEPLRHQLRSENASTRQAAALALAWLRVETARDELTQLATTEEDSEVREAATLAVAYLSQPPPAALETRFSPY
ncbi:HEAT repeat domain-containing protein [Armatimonas rosea]|uniref:HEAT repeat protein n=1 Tax=Armatimonas rosea TaxID=685828 RepID=A0A7W9W5Y5_ARMRO|nr:HEAT repeat domain-containing protein [Armatimonas rosea]MBB6049440.1 HEAT repeat protein [Armatimonas rosea]